MAKIERYQPLQLANVDNTASLARDVEAELHKIAAAINGLMGGTREVRGAAPEKPSNGDVAFADGTKWNPGSGIGWYWYDEANTTWVLF